MICASWPSNCNLCQTAVLLQLTQSDQACPLHGRHPNTASLFGYKFWGDGGFLITQFPDMKVNSYCHQLTHSHQHPLHTRTRTRIHPGPENHQTSLCWSICPTGSPLRGSTWAPGNLTLLNSGGQAAALFPLFLSTWSCTLSLQAWGHFNKSVPTQRVPAGRRSKVFLPASF